MYLKKLRDYEGCCFYKKNLTHVYIFAAVLGYLNNLRSPSKNKSDLRLYRELSAEDKILIRCIVLKEKKYDFNELIKGKEILKIIEEYANGGAPLLFDQIINSTNDKSFEENIWQQIKELQNSK